MKKPIAVIVGDIHFSLYSKFNRQLDDGRNSRAQLLIDEVKRIFEYTIENNIKHVIFLGDIFDTAEVIKTSLFNDVYDLFYTYSNNYGLDIIAIAGNHDYFSYNSFSALHSLKSFMSVIDGPMEIKTIGGFSFAFCPYIQYENKFQYDISSALTDTSADILFCHQSVDGVKIGSYELVKQKDAINPKKLFEKFKVIISGHIHKKQTCENVIFPGSIAQKDFGDEGIQKYFSVLYDDLSIEYILTKHPKFYTIDYLEGDDREEIKNEKDAKSLDLEKDFVKVKASKELWKRLSQTIYRDKNVIIDLKPDKRITAVRVEIGDLSNNRKVLNNYLSFVGKNDEWVLKNKKELLEKGLEYLE